MQTTKILYTTLTIALAVPAVANAATDGAPGSAKAARAFPEMTSDDCTALQSRKSSYGASEFKQRTEYCAKLTSHDTSRRDGDKEDGSNQVPGGASGATRSDTPSESDSTSKGSSAAH